MNVQTGPKLSRWEKFVSTCCSCFSISKTDNEVSRVSQEALATHRRRQEAITESPQSVPKSPPQQTRSIHRSKKFESTEWISIRRVLKEKEDSL